MTSRKIISSGIVKAFTALSLVATPGGAALGLDAPPPAPPVPYMRIQIFNNSPTTNIYPVLSTGTSETGDWLRTWFKVRKADLANYPYPKKSQFRLYINPTGKGIPPGQAITIALPLVTQIVPNPNPKLADQYIDWWGGGRVEIFDGPANAGPPAALTANYNRNLPAAVTAVSGSVGPTLRCSFTPCDPSTMKIFKDGAGLKNNEPTQLTEYTLGALDRTKDPWGLNPHNVDFDVSYVDTAYLPAAMEPVNNPQVGYVGTVQTVEAFRAAVTKFTTTPAYVGWPQFIDNQKKKILKIPSAMHVLAGDPDLTPGPWAPITRLTANWNACLPFVNFETFCKNIRKIRTMFIHNYNNYTRTFAASAACDHSQTPGALTEESIRRHVYKWTPFNEFCAADFNLLEKTPGYTGVNIKNYNDRKEEFDNLQNGDPTAGQVIPPGKFNPYVLLIHDKAYIDAPNVYAYSVDDAVGNMQADGDGFVIAVGGKRGLPNGKPAGPPIHVGLGYAKTDQIRFVKYGVCTMTPDKNVNPDFASFDFYPSSFPTCPISLIDNKGQIYTFRIKSKPPYAALVDSRQGPANFEPIDCSGNVDQKAKDWCRTPPLGGVFAHTVKEAKKDKSFAITPAPAQPPKAPAPPSD